ncbi:helix-turn-helix domain-containing protein [Streptomyces sp. NPDC050211]|uniref:helix-turn-helix domain-containing protein n=1 Tax=Streptomyces sp. NPDC050211 TaxID=3154932 RepID=UPI00343ACBC4
MVQHRGEAALFDGWRAHAQSRLSAGDLPVLARGIAVPGKGMLDLFTLVGTVPEVDSALDGLLSDPRPLRNELSLYPPKGQAMLPPWVFTAAQGNGAAARRLDRGLRDAYHATVAPYWERIQALVHTERAAAIHVMAAEGVGAMLASLHPSLRWQQPVLEFPFLPWTNSLDIDLAGGGLLLAPSVFCRHPLMFRSPSGELMLIYPVVRDVLAAAGIFAATGPAGQAVAGLLGRTRAAVLETTGTGATTGQIADRLRISPASASQHTAVLREAGLVSSRRQGKTVCHTLTPLGKALLNGRHTARTR